MAIKWSWAFGTETPTVLEEMGWDWQNVAGGAVSTTQTYSYVGSPTRRSMSQDDPLFNELFRVPTPAFSPQGWVSTAVYFDSATALSGKTILSVLGGSSNRSIYIRLDNAATNTAQLYVDNTPKQTFTLLGDRWNYIALQYDMSAISWTGRVFVDGVAVTSTQTDSRSAETTGGIFLGGITDGFFTYYAQVIVYDDTADSGETPYFVTRVDPMADTSTTPGVGWTSTAADNHSALESPFDSTSYVNNDPTAGGNDVIVSTTNLATQLGTVPTTVAAVTVHTWATGSGVTGRTELSDDNATYTAGNTITPSVNATYSYVTDTTLPSSGGLTPWTSASDIYYKYEVI